MTNEQLAGFIKAGGNDELIPLLWANIKKLMYMKSDRAYRLYNGTCDKAGVTPMDIKQVCYNAFLKAIEAYKPDGKYPFNSYLKYPFKNEFNQLIGIRKKSDPLNDCTSLDKPVKDTEDLTLKDTVLDDFDLEESVTETVGAEQINAIIWREVEKLPERECAVIKSRFKNGSTQQSIAEKLNISNSRVHQIEASALRKLRCSDELKKLADVYGYDSYKIYSSSLSRFKNTGLSSVEEVAISRADIIARSKMLTNANICII